MAPETQVAPARLSIVVGGDPVPWQRARQNGRRHFTDPKVAEFKERVRVGWMVAGRRSFGNGPVVLTTARFVFARKRSHLLKGGGVAKGAPLWPPCDNDNLLKGALDALTGLAYDDDRQIVRYDGLVERRYVELGEEPFTELELRPA